MVRELRTYFPLGSYPYPVTFLRPVVLPDLYFEAMSDQQVIIALECAVKKLIAEQGSWMTTEEFEIWLETYIKDQQEQTEILKEYADHVAQTLREYVDTQDDSIRERLKYEVKRLEKMIEESRHETSVIFDPTKGIYNSVEDTIRRVYTFLRVHCLDAVEYNLLNLDAKQYDELGLTAEEYDVRSKTILKTDMRWHDYSPITGRLVSIHTILRELADLHKSDWDALTYDEQGFTADEYDGFGWDARYADFYNYLGR